MDFINIFKPVGTVLNRFIPRVENKQDGRYTYGAKDNLPQEWIEMIAANSTALRAVLKKAEYIAAKGFVKPELNDFLVTKGKTAHKLLIETAIQVAFFESVTWHIARSADGKIASADGFPFELCRRCIGGSQIAYNNTLGTNQLKNVWTHYPVFSKEVPNMKGYKGEILYEWNKTPIAFNFPIPSWFAAEYTIRTGAELALMDLEQAENGFMASAMLTYIGQLDNVQKDVEGLTQQGRFERLMKKWTSKSKDPATGKSQRHSLITMTAASKEEVPVLQSFDVEGMITGSIEKKEAVDKDTCRAFNVNPVLMDWEGTAILGQDGALKNAKGLQADSVLPYQNMIKECFEKVFPDMGWNITTLNPFMSVVEKSADQKILDTLNTMSPLLATKAVDIIPKKVFARMMGIAPEDMPTETTDNVNQ